jgi:hypothetical protein
MVAILIPNSIYSDQDTKFKNKLQSKSRVCRSGCRQASAILPMAGHDIARTPDDYSGDFDSAMALTAGPASYFAASTNGEQKNQGTQRGYRWLL